METWSRASEGKSPMLCDEIGSRADAPARTGNISMGWNMKTSCNFGNMVVSSREAIDSMEFMELGFPEKSNPSNPSMDLFVGEIGNNFCKTIPSPASVITSNSSFGKLESVLSLSSPVIESNSQKTTLIDLKVETDGRQAKNSRFLNKRTALSLVGSSLTSKRARTANLYSQDPVCQVYNCNKDLSSSKEYLKRHKVCDVHSKTAKVVVNGIEQRFCQQCSRFHLLAEFDDGKRSCRKRLAGHNERRRKPQLDILSGKPLKLLQYYQGIRSLRASLAKRSSFVFPDMLPGGFISPQQNDLVNQFSHIKVEEGSIHSPRLPMLTTNRQFLSKPAFHLHGMGRQYSPENFSSQTGYSSLETASMVQELSGVSISNNAPSLLSAQSKILSSHFTGIPMASPLIIPDANNHCCVDQNSEKLEGVGVEEKFSPNGFCSGMNSMEVFDAGSSTNFEVQAGGFFQRSDCLKAESFLSPEHVPTVDLIQLSSHLQRVEQQRNFVQVKQENDVFCSFPTM